MKPAKEIRKITASDYKDFRGMFREYFIKDLGIDISEEQLESVCTEIMQQVEKQVMFLDLLTLDGNTKGFINYQVDTPQSDWCEKEGHGFIREVYIEAGIRKRGLGRELITHTEDQFLEQGVASIYLTTAYESKEFWIKCGYKDTGEISRKNHYPIYAK